MIKIDKSQVPVPERLLGKGQELTEANDFVATQQNQALESKD